LSLGSYLAGMQQSMLTTKVHESGCYSVVCGGDWLMMRVL